nr:immunoglobulin light chain junction region [Macaca mulatta]MPO05231.1 immunoglobulin light chain junction region [Macaca mulatta]MPO06603.1 immunoglobulin light chain junction region [Macaca mulatta]MPO06790.1 immunoglobulin light chain junction region [Macaca mulatta]MPO07637.1 immunoglobulin light chain junction region [Macaca mulatta]
CSAWGSSLSTRFF